MKYLLLTLLLAPLFSYSQTLALLDRKLMSPMKLTDSIPLSEVQSGLFPVYLQDLDSVIQTLEVYRKWIDSGKDSLPGPQQKVIGHSSFYTDIYTYGSRDRYRIVFSTANDEYKTSMVLVYKDLSTKQAIQNLSEFIDYLRNNLAVVRDGP
jgi:hypothetical protein